MYVRTCSRPTTAAGAFTRMKCLCVCKTFTTLSPPAE
uniref:Uncharacterized protein n=1 Tax=Anopheles atroparvus TaxID=41427 RepID=A0AAG5CS99_ANOAO